MSRDLDYKKKIEVLEKKLKSRQASAEEVRAELESLSLELEKLINQVHSDMKVVGTIQKLFSPVEFKGIPDFQFSTKYVAGDKGSDYYDFFPRKDDFQFSFLIGGTRGARSGSLLMQFMFNFNEKITLASKNKPSLALQALVEELGPHLDSSMQMSLAYVSVDRKTFDLNYSGMGDVLGFWWSTKAETLSDLKMPVSAPLSQGFLGNLMDKSLNLEPKDVIVFLSPGALAITNPSGEPLGEGRLRQIIHQSLRSDVHELRNEIFYQLGKFSQNTKDFTRWPEDVTVIVAAVKDRILKLA